MPKVSPEYRDQQRRRILDSAAGCFSVKGFRATSMADIVEACGLSPGAIYRYFVGKDEIIGAIADERHAYESQLVADALAQPDLREGLQALAQGYFEWLKDPLEQQRRRLTVQVWAAALHDPALATTMSFGADERRRLVEALRAEAAARGREVDAVEADAQVRVMLAILQGFVLQQAWEPDVDVDAYARVVGHLIESVERDD